MLSSREALDPSASHPDADTESKLDWKNQRQQQARKRKRENDLKKTEDTIEALELRNEELDMLMALPENCSNVEVLTGLANEKEDNLQKLDTLYKKWEMLEEEAGVTSPPVSS